MYYIELYIHIMKQIKIYIIKIKVLVIFNKLINIYYTFVEKNFFIFFYLY